MLYFNEYASTQTYERLLIGPSARFTNSLSTFQVGQHCGSDILQRMHSISTSPTNKPAQIVTYLQLKLQQPLLCYDAGNQIDEAEKLQPRGASDSDIAKFSAVLSAVNAWHEGVEEEEWSKNTHSTAEAHSAMSPWAEASPARNARRGIGSLLLNCVSTSVFNSDNDHEAWVALGRPFRTAPVTSEVRSLRGTRGTG